MTNASWLRRLTSRRPVDTRRPTARPQVEALEDRCLLAVGALDTTFDTDGRQTFRFLSPADNTRADGRVIVQTDGKAVVAGTFRLVGSASDFAVARFNVNGSVDTTFGNFGRVNINFGGGTNSEEEARDVALQADGKIVVAGFFTNSPGNDAFAVARLNTDGSLDTSFDTDGRQLININNGSDRADSVAIQTDGRIVLGGGRDLNDPGADFALVRLTAAGAPDATFGPGGIRSKTFGAGDRGNAVAIQADNKIVLAGNTNAAGSPGGFDFGIWRVNADGTDDETFGPGGIRRVDVAGGSDQANGLVIQADGKIVVGGNDTSAASSFNTIRLNTDGTLDTTYNTTGKKTRSAGVLRCSDLALQNDGKILQSGYGPGGGVDFAVVRINTNGSDDTTFGPAGLQTVDFGGVDLSANVAVDRIGRIVLAGTAGDANAANNQMGVARLIGIDRIHTGGLFNPATGQWVLNNRNAPGAPFIPAFNFGGANFLPIVGDWDGDGDFTVGAYDPVTSSFYIRNANGPGATDVPVFAFGLPGFIPVAGDWDGDGRWGFGVYDIKTGNWYLKNTLSPGAPDGGSFPFGGPGLVPVVGDWNGDGTWTIGVVQTATATWFLNDFNRAGGPTTTPFVYGTPNQKYLAGDWNGDNISTPGVFTTTGQWLLRNANSAGAADVTFTFGLGTFSPVAGDYDFPTAALHVAGGQGPGAAPLSSGDLGAIVDAAITRLADAGVDPDTLALLSAVRVEARDLPDDLLGYAFEDSGTLVIDADAAGHGWFIDPTPMQDEEFASGQGPGGVDLLTVVLHELGHFAGLSDETGSGGLMDGLLPVGLRRLGGLDALFASAGLASKHGK